MSQFLKCCHRWGIGTEMVNAEKGELIKYTARFCPVCSTWWQSNQTMPVVYIGEIVDLAVGEEPRNPTR